MDKKEFSSTFVIMSTFKSEISSNIMLLIYSHNDENTESK